MLQDSVELLNTWTFGGPVHRVDMRHDGRKIGDYAEYVEYYSLGDKYKAEIDWRVPVTFTVKDKTFNKVIFQETRSANVNDLGRALQEMAVQTRDAKNAVVAEQKTQSVAVITKNFIHRVIGHIQDRTKTH